MHVNDYPWPHADDPSFECYTLTFVFGVGSARWPDGPPQSGVAHGFCLIPVSGVGVVCIVRSVADNEQKVRVRAYCEVLSVHPRRVHGSCHCLDARSVREKKLHG